MGAGCKLSWHQEKIVVGTCGLPAKVKNLINKIDGVEIQETFYNPIGEKRFKKLAELTRLGLVLTMKAWQVITHPSSSPTWRRLRKKPEGRIDNYGYLKPSEENFNALEQSLRIATSIGAEVMVLQTPPSMKCVGREQELRSFFSTASGISSKNKVMIAWEPRGECRKADVLLESLAHDYEVIIIRDAGKEKVKPYTVGGRRVLYTRLHGKNGGEVNYKYYYSDSDLLVIKENVKGNTFDIAYIMFNNIFMLENAVKFRELISNST